MPSRAAERMRASMGRRGGDPRYYGSGTRRSPRRYALRRLSPRGRRVRGCGTKCEGILSRRSAELVEYEGDWQEPRRGTPPARRRGAGPDRSAMMRGLLTLTAVATLATACALPKVGGAPVAPVERN